MTFITEQALASRCAASLRTIAERAPRVHCITNIVAMNYTANMLLAVGAVPSMSLAVEEIGDFVARADGLLINLGMLDASRKPAIEKAIQSARARAIPWVLDPAFVDASANRQRYGRELLRQRPSVIRGNASEIVTLAAGTDNAAPALALASGCVVAQTGREDLITDGRHSLTLAHGHPLMARITALGCAASALLAAFLAVADDPLLAAAETLLALGVAGETAAARVNGPGSLQSAILDQLYRLDQSPFPPPPVGR